MIPVKNIICHSITHLGCAAVKFGEPNFYKMLLVCNYGPYLCLDGNALYKTGRIGTHCRGKLAKTGMCTSKERRSVWVPPFSKR